MNKKLKKTLLKIGIGLMLIAGIIILVDWGQVWMYLQKVHVIQLALYVVVYIIGVAISSWKWFYIAQHKDIHQPYFDFFKLYNVGIFINNFMPSFIGGDAFKVYQIGKKKRCFYEAASTVVVDRMTGLWGVMMLSVFFAFLNISTIMEYTPLFIINGLLLVVTLFSLFIFRPRKVKIYKACGNIFERLLSSNTPETSEDSSLLKIRKAWDNAIRKMNKALCRTLEEMERYGDNLLLAKTLVFAFLFSFVGLALANYMLFLSLGVFIPLLDFLSVIFLISIVASIPISIGNLGVKEWAYVFFFGLFGVELSLAVTVVILSRIVQMLVSFAALPLYWRYREQVLRKDNTLSVVNTHGK